MARQTRRVIAGHDASGKAVVMADGPAPNTKVRQVTGLTSTLVWVTEGAPADISTAADPTQREIGVAPPASGSIQAVQSGHHDPSCLVASCSQSSGFGGLCGLVQ